MELCYEGAMIGTNAYNVHFSSLCIWQVTDLAYCIDCYASSDCFLCFGLRHSKFAILNKTYPEAEYRQLRARVVESMLADGSYGEFFPIEFSQFGYNESTAQQWFPLSREQALASGWKWQDNLPGTRGKETLPSVPDTIDEVDARITNEILACTCCAKNYKIILPEFEFYQRRGIPLPDRCFECRRQARASKRNPRHFWQRFCEQCGTHVESTYEPSRPEIVYCERCYLK